jgi:acyl carrier protein
MKSFEKDGLEKELIEMIIEVCNIIDPVPEELSPNDPLIGPESALGLDSLDAVEIVSRRGKEISYPHRLTGNDAQDIQVT